MKDMKVDVAILGAGTAGLSALKAVIKAKKKFVVIDPGPLGTTCARVGCMPSKLLLQAAEDHHRCGGKLNAPAMLRALRKKRDQFTDPVIERTEALGKNFINSRAEWIEPGVLSAGPQKIVAKNVILATGSHPIVPEGWEALTSDTIFELEDLPKSLAVFGLGPLGAELGQALSRLGVEIEAYNLDENLAGLTDPELNKIVLQILKKDMKVTFGKSDAKAAGHKKILASLGRKPNLKGLGLETIGVEFDEKGIPKYNPKTLKIKKHNIFIAGDVRAQKSVLHEAQDAGRRAGLAACGKKVPPAQRTGLSICFISPNAATVGQRYKDLKSFKTGRVEFSDQGRAKIMGENLGALHVYADKNSGQLLGAEMICPAGEHLAHLLGLAISQKLSAKDLLKMPFYHPTLEEGLRTALRQVQG